MYDYAVSFGAHGNLQTNLQDCKSRCDQSRRRTPQASSIRSELARVSFPPRTIIAAVLFTCIPLSFAQATELSKGPHGSQFLLTKTNGVQTQAAGTGRCTTIEVKFKDSRRVRLKEGKPMVTNGPAFSQVTQALLHNVKASRWKRLFNVLSVRNIDNLRNQASKLGKKKLPDLNNYFSICIPRNAIKQTLAVLNDSQVSEIEFAEEMPYRQSLPVVPDFTSLTNPTGFYQRYLNNPGDGGIGIVTVWSLPGGRGANVTVTDVEYDFIKSHNELADRVEDLGAGSPQLPGKFSAHGTASLGVIGSSSDGIGTTGVAPDATLRFSAVGGGGSLAQVNIGNALLFGAGKVGDVIVVEQQVAGPLRTASDGDEDQFGLVPAEWNRAVYDVIRTLTAMGQVVVEAAGNGVQNLDDPTYSLPHTHRPFIPGRESGAILVGAGWPNGSSTRGTRPESGLRTYFSNFGSRLDLQGWGLGVVAPGYGDLFDAEGEQAVYTLYSGTSSATAMVGGAIAAIQGHFRNQYGRVATADELRFLLQATGSAQPNLQNDRIGPLPNLEAAVAFLASRLATPVFQCMLCPGSPPVGSGAFPPPRFDPPSNAFLGTYEVRVDVRQGLNPEFARILWTVDGSEPDPQGRPTSEGGNGFLADPNATIFLESTQLLKARSVLYPPNGRPIPSWAPIVSDPVTLFFKGAAPLAVGQTIRILPTGERTLQDTAMLFTTNGQIPDIDGYGYSDGGVGSVLSNEITGDAFTMNQSGIILTARSYMRGLCKPTAPIPDEQLCQPGERPHSAPVTAVYSLIDGTVPPPTFSLGMFSTWPQGTLLTVTPPPGLDNVTTWITVVDPALLEPGEPYPFGPHSIIYTGPIQVFPQNGNTAVYNARSYARTSNNTIESASEINFVSLTVTP